MSAIFFLAMCICFMQRQTMRVLIELGYMDEDPVLPCSEKLAFDTKKEADAAAVVADFQHDAKVASYLCQHCSLWHLKSVY